MCGIAGQVTADRRPVEARVIAAMGGRLSHRGPDDAGLHVDGHVGLAHRRLSVLDLSQAGRQPMANESGTVWIVYNGEIYNFEELRDSLRSRYAFRSRTDTEVVLRLYEEYGLQCLPMLRGMFAFAIWDKRAQRLVLARDRLGKKPLFYSIRGARLSFASELKALLADGPSPPIDPVALHHYLTFQYVPAPRTIFQGVRKLPPGHVLVYEDGKGSESAYWSLDYVAKRTWRSEEACREEFLALLEESVKLRLISDVPLGAFLSGGMDSSSVVALMSRLTRQPVKTFSIGFKDEAFNELPYAGTVAEKFETDHHEFVVEPSAVEILPTLVRVYDEPFADASAIPTYCVSQLSRQYVTVVLNGDGGDELLAGYPRYAFTLWDELGSRWLSDPARDRFSRWIGGALGRVPGLGRARNRLDRALTPFARAYMARICYFSPAEKGGLYAPGFFETVRDKDSYDLLTDWFDRAQASTLLDRLLWVDTHSYLPDDLLVKVDRATMAHGLEARSPFLDHRLAEFCAALPVRLKVRNGQSKYLLKRVMQDLLPASILERPKMGFGVPIDRWFREDCRDFVRDILLADRCLARGYFRPERVRQMLDVHQRGEADYGSRLYALLMLELWHREYADHHGSRSI
ncbi:MAG: asparagine synthase (glutamine-hydrolyzing) [Nitrospirota bacterium]